MRALWRTAVALLIAAPFSLPAIAQPTVGDTAPLSGWTRLTVNAGQTGFALPDALVKIERRAAGPASPPSYGTGIIVSPTAILTVAHNVPACNGDQAVRFATLRRLDSDPSSNGPYRRVKSVHCYNEVPFSDEAGHTDLAILRLAQPIPKYKPVFQLVTSDAKAACPAIRIAGFKKRTRIATEQTGRAGRIGDDRIYYPHSTQEGQSGSPVIALAETPGQLLTVIGLHKSGPALSAPTGAGHLSTAVRFTPPILDWIARMAEQQAISAPPPFDVEPTSPK